MICTIAFLVISISELFSLVQIGISSRSDFCLCDFVFVFIVFLLPSNFTNCS